MKLKADLTAILYKPAAAASCIKQAAAALFYKNLLLKQLDPLYGALWSDPEDALKVVKVIMAQQSK